MSNGRSIIHYSDELRKLFSVMQIRYLTDEMCYTISVNGNIFVIPPEYSEIAKKVFDSAEDKSEYEEDTVLYYGIGAVKE